MRKPWMAVLMLLIAQAAMATNGYFMHGQGTMSKGMAGAGVALPREALDLANNPAAAAWIESSWTAELSLFSPDRRYSIDGAPSMQPQTFGLTPGTVSSESKLFPMPSLGFNYRASETSGFGASMIAHGGMNTDYRTNTFYGSSHTGVDLAQLYLSGTYAKKFLENHSAGISLIGVAQRFKASGLEAFGGFSSDATNLTGNGYDMSWGAGIQVGYLGYLTRDLSIGATYMPKVSMSALDKYRGLFAEGGSFDIPSSLAAGLALRLGDNVTLAGDFQRIHYSDVRSVGNPLLPNLMLGPLGGDDGAGFGWKDINVYKIGMDWQATDDWAFRAGYSKSDQPIPDSEVLFNILAPGVIEQHFTAGLTHSLNRGGKMNLGFMYAPTATVAGPNPLEMPGRQQIKLQMNQWQVDFSYSVGF